jgi:hypothetical protein
METEDRRLDQLRAARDEAERAMTAARDVYRRAGAEYAKTRRAYRKALDAVVTYRDRTQQERNWEKQEGKA